MSETRAVTLETQVDTAGARAGFNEIAREAGTMAQAVARSSEQAEVAITRIGDGGNAATRKAEAAQRTLIASIERATVAAQAGGRATSEYYELIARQRGVDPAVLQPYLNQLREIEQLQARAAQTLTDQQAAARQAAEATRAQAAAQRELDQAQANRDSFIIGLRDQVALFGRSADEALRYRAAQLGAASDAEPLIAQLRAMREAQEQAAAAAVVMERAQREASQVNTSRDAFLNGLREEIALFGRSAEEVQLYRAAQLNAANAAGPLLAQLRSLREAEEQAAVASRAMEQAQREALQMDTSRDAFLNSLREQVALFGRSADQALQYRAAQLGAANAAEPLIAQLRALRTAQEQANQAERDQTGRDAFVANLREQADAIGRTRTELLELRAAQLGVTQQAAPFIARLREAEHGMQGTGVSAAQTAAALRMVPAQMTDIVVSLQSGQAPMTVLLQQGGQLKDMFGGAGSAAKALGGYVLGLVNPYTIAAAAAAGLAYAYKVGHDEYLEYVRSLALTGNVIGATTGQLGDMASRIGEVTGSQHEAAAALVEITNAGGVSLANLERFGTEAVAAQHVFGKSVKETADELADLGKAPLSALDKINEKYHFITAATYAQVKALQDHGESIKAASVAQNAYIDGITTQRQKVLDSLTDWERGWLRIKKAASGAVDAVIDFATGREATGNEKIKALLTEREAIEVRIEQLKKRGQARDGNAYNPERDADVLAAEAALDANKREINSIRDKEGAKKKAAEEEGKTARADELRNKWLGESNILLTRQQQLQRDLTAARTEGEANGLSEEEIQNRLIVVRRKYNDVVTTGIETSIAALRRRADIENEVDQRKLAQIAAQQAAGSITEDEAIQRTAEIELGILDRQKRTLQGQLDLTRSKLNSSAQQADLNGQIALTSEQRLTREKQLTNDLIALDRQRFEASVKAVDASFDKAASDRDSLRAQARDQRDYNAQIGMTAEELFNLAAARLEEQAARKDSEAEIAEGLDLNGELAGLYRQQAVALRDRAAAEREGFVKSRDPYVNLSISLKRYGEEAQNVGGMVGDALTNAFRSAEDAFADFVTTGKLNFRDLATSIIADFARIQAKSAIGGFASSLLGSIGTDTTTGWGATLLKSISGARAAGGPVNAGLSYLVGEKGPEIFTPSSSGAITPNHMIGAGGAGGNININTSVQVTSGGATSSTGGDQSTAGKALADMIAAKAKEVILRESRQGGVIWNMRTGRA